MQCPTELELKEEFEHVINESNCDDTDTNCSLVYDVCRDLILESRLTTEACLAGNGSTSDHRHNHDDDDDDVSDSEG